MNSPERLTASEAVAQLTAGTLTAEGLTRACLEQARAGAEIKAWAWLDPEQAIAQTRAVDRAGRKGLLAGVPVGIKDIIDTVDMPTGHGSPIYPRRRPFADAACVALIRAASGVILGKTVTTEFANRHPGPTVHPHNAEHTPGGSSSGSAAAVADFQVPLALGTQTGGSVIRPAAFCGVLGYKPSFGEFSRVGVKMQCHNLDTLGIICRSLEDIALLRGVLLAQQPHPVDRRSAAPHIGFCRTPAWEHADRDTQALLQRTAEVLAAAGAKVREVALTPADILDHHRRIFEFEAARNYAYEYEVHGEKLSPALRGGALGARPRPAACRLYRGDRNGGGVSPQPRRYFRRSRRAARPERPGRSSEGARLDRRRPLQRDLDAGLDTLPDLARRQWPQRVAARHSTGRSALPRRGAARRSRLG